MEQSNQAPERNFVLSNHYSISRQTLVDLDLVQSNNQQSGLDNEQKDHIQFSTNSIHPLSTRYSYY